MYDSQSNRSRKIIYAVIGIAIAVVFMIITISIVAMNASGGREANIINEQQNMQSEQISDKLLTDIKKGLYALLSDTSGANKNFDVAVRWDSMKMQDYNNYASGSVLIDVDEYKQTYQANIASDSLVEITCPKIGESKYPESFCIGNAGDYDDSIYVVFGENLPYNGYTSENEYVVIDRNRNMKDINDRYLDIRVINCSGDESAKDRANAFVDEVITSLGASPELLSERKITVETCHGE